MIGGLQGEFGDLDIKYLKQNSSKCRSHITGSFRKTSRHCAKWLRNSPSECYQRIRTCLTGQNSGSEISARRKGDRLRVQGVGTPPPDDTERALLFRASPSGFTKRTRAAILSGATPSGFPKRTRAAMLSGLPQGEAHDTRSSHPGRYHILSGYVVRIIN